jgi:hypothetical protein
VKSNPPGPGLVPASVILVTYLKMLSQYGKLHYCLATKFVEQIGSERPIMASQVLKRDAVQGRM